MHKIDFKALTEATRSYNFHTHTPYCDGHDTIDDMCRAALNAGITHLGFTPHSPIPIASPCNISVDDVTRYADDINRVRETYPSLHIYKSMEVDYLGDQWGSRSQWFMEAGLDYLISSVHFIPDLNGEYVDIDGSAQRFANTLANRFGGDLKKLVNTFFDQSEKMIHTGGFDIIGHFDKIAMNATTIDPDVESCDWYHKRIDTLIDMIVASGVGVEINTKAYMPHGRFFPHTRYFERLIRAGVTLIVNSDAHYAARICDGRDEAFAAIDSIKSRINS